MQIVSEIVNFYTPPHDSGGVLWFHVGRPCVSLSVRFLFQETSVDFTKLGVCIDMEIWAQLFKANDAVS